MKGNITHDSSNSFDKKGKKVVAPSVETLNFLRLFARTYHVEKKLPEYLSGICLS